MLSLHRAYSHNHNRFQSFSHFIQYSLTGLPVQPFIDCEIKLTWKTLGALTNEAKAEDRVAEKIPAVIRGPKPDTRLITWTTQTHTLTSFRFTVTIHSEIT